MTALPSGLDEAVADEECLARFLTSSGHYSLSMPKFGAFLPNPKDMATSVFRHYEQPLDSLWAIAESYVVANGRSLHGAAFVSALAVREAKLEVQAAEPPPRHADIVGWPQVPEDPELQKARQKDCAAILARNAKLVLR